EGRVAYATIQTLEKIPRRIELVARGVAGHGSVPLKTNPVVRLAGAVARVGDWRPPIRLNETTAAYFPRLPPTSPPRAAHARPATRRLFSARAVGKGRGGGAGGCRLAFRTGAAPLVDAAHVSLAEHHHRRLSVQCHPFTGDRHDRRAPAARRGPGGVSRAGE